MKRNFSKLLQIIAIFCLAIVSVNLAHAQAQLPPDASLDAQLKAQYKVTKFGLDSTGFTVISPATILVIQKGGILGVPPAQMGIGVSVFKDGELKQPSAGQRMFLGTQTRFLEVGEKMYVQKVDVNLKLDKIQITVVECDQCNGVNQPSLYKGAVAFEFAKGSLAAADPGMIEDTIAQVFTIDDGGNGNQQQNQDQNAQQGQQQEQQPQQQPPQQQAPPPEPTSIQMGMTVDQVESALGAPDKKVSIGAKLIYVYKDLKVTFTNGKVTDAQ
jgi:hypothetical protein